MKVAIFGGSFNPIHSGHLKIAKQALKIKGIDEVWFMPTAHTPLKEDIMISKEHRIAMILRAIKPYKKMKLCEYEIHLNQTSYTIDTVEYLNKEYPNIQFSWLIGSDQTKQFTKWKSYKELLSKIPFYVFSRSGDEKILLDNMIDIPMELIDVSSTEIRRGKKFYLLPKSVRNYMLKHHLYLDEFVQSFLSTKRYGHTKRVADLMVTLSKYHDVNQEEAYVAGMLHDLAKEFNKEELFVYMKNLDSKYLDYPIGVWHGFVAPLVIRRYGLDVNKKVYHAISHHVLGDGHTLLAKLLYIADKIEPGREYDTSELLELAKVDVDITVQRIKEESLEYLRGKGVIIE